MTPEEMRRLKAIVQSLKDKQPPTLPRGKNAWRQAPTTGDDRLVAPGTAGILKKWFDQESIT